MDYTYDEIIGYVQLYFTTGVRWVFLGLAALVLLHQIFALIKMRNPSEIWAYLYCPDGSNVPLTHWENLVGRHRGCDIILNLKSVSRSHGTLIRNSEGVWEYNDLESKNGSLINGDPVHEPTVLKDGDVLTIGGSEFRFSPLSFEERMENIERRKRNTKRTSPWLSMLAITVFQVLTVMQFRVSLGDNFPAQLPVAFGLLSVLMWVYVIVLRICKRTGFEVEIIAFFLSTLSLAVTTSAYPSTVLKQSICVLLGVAFFFALCWLLRDLQKAKKLIRIFIAISILLLLINLMFGTAKFGSQNWLKIGGFSFQPSELVKIVFIFVGAATLDELQQKKNLLIFMGFSVFCLGCLAVMGDFGTAIIFFATFLVVSFLRSGDFTKLALIIGAAGLMGLMVLRFRPYVATRFETWGHVWEDPTGDGYQQVQTMTSIASGGLPGLGAGEGNLSDVGAASTDLVFGVLAEEWGLVIAILAVLCIITLGVFAYRSIIAGRSTYYCIAACATTSLFMFQTILNVFGSIDLLPLTGVTFPFVSSGGTSMIASWGMLAFLKAADTRQNASLAVRVKELNSSASFPKESLSATDYDDLREFLDDDLFKNTHNTAPSRETIHMTAPVKEKIRRAEPVRDFIMPGEIKPERRSEDRSAPETQAVTTPKTPPSKAASERAGQKPEAPAHPKKVTYTELSDDDFFSQFEKGDSRKSGSSRTSRETSALPNKAKDELKQNKPLTLDDIFGDDGLFGGDKK